MARSIYQAAMDRFNRKEITAEQFKAECARLSLENPLPRKRGTRDLSEKRSQKSIRQQNEKQADSFWAEVLV